MASAFARARIVRRTDKEPKHLRRAAVAIGLRGAWAEAVWIPDPAVDALGAVLRFVDERWAVITVGPIPRRTACAVTLRNGALHRDSAAVAVCVVPAQFLAHWWDSRMSCRAHRAIRARVDAGPAERAVAAGPVTAARAFALEGSRIAFDGNGIRAAVIFDATLKKALWKHFVTISARGAVQHGIVF